MNPEEFFRGLIEYVSIKRNIKIIILVLLTQVLGFVMSILSYKSLSAFFAIIILGLLGHLLYQELDRLHTLIARLREADHKD